MGDASCSNLAPKTKIRDFAGSSVHALPRNIHSITSRTASSQRHGFLQQMDRRFVRIRQKTPIPKPGRMFRFLTTRHVVNDICRVKRCGAGGKYVIALIAISEIPLNRAERASPAFSGLVSDRVAPDTQVVLNAYIQGMITARDEFCPTLASCPPRLPSPALTRRVAACLIACRSSRKRVVFHVQPRP